MTIPTGDRYREGGGGCRNVRAAGGPPEPPPVGRRRSSSAFAIGTPTAGGGCRNVRAAGGLNVRKRSPPPIPSTASGWTSLQPLTTPPLPSRCKRVPLSDYHATFYKGFSRLPPVFLRNSVARPAAGARSAPAAGSQQASGWPLFGITGESKPRTLPTCSRPGGGGQEGISKNLGGFRNVSHGFPRPFTKLSRAGRRAPFDLPADRV